MDVLLIIARLLHVTAGVFWAGSMLFIARFLMPAIADVGPTGGQVMQALAKRGLMIAMPASAVVTVLAGIYLFYRVSGGFDPVYMGSGPGITYSIGGLSAIIALIIGGISARVSIEKLLKLGESLPSTPEANRPAVVAEMDALRKKSASTQRLVAVLLMITVLCMAVGRYV